MEVQSTLHKRFGLRIKELREERKLTQEDLAFAIRVDRSYMGFIERGERNPTLEVIGRIAKALGIKLRVLFDIGE
ncbi:hypothetical protein A2956_02465 [Candidatus Roizmanbacteria bacterium RIFCSPLOWO2_01_FULL_37_57]|nr:MAG: hypothetical protein A2956_02465 [Candidatus Roizmanbacteria bacterium RIFCSPLOWO2_01_FULL_37_57]